MYTVVISSFLVIWFLSLSLTMAAPPSVPGPPSLTPTRALRSSYITQHSLAIYIYIFFQLFIFALLCSPPLSHPVLTQPLSPSYLFKIPTASANWPLSHFIFVSLETHVASIICGPFNAPFFFWEGGGGGGFRCCLVTL